MNSNVLINLVKSKCFLRFLNLDLPDERIKGFLFEQNHGDPVILCIRVLTKSEIPIPKSEIKASLLFRWLRVGVRYL